MHTNEELCEALAEQRRDLGARYDALRAEMTAVQDRARKEIERLQDLVHAAYSEGFNEGMREHSTSSGGKTWGQSRACKNIQPQLG